MAQFRDTSTYNVITAVNMSDCAAAKTMTALHEIAEIMIEHHPEELGAIKANS